MKLRAPPATYPNWFFGIDRGQAHCVNADLNLEHARTDYAASAGDRGGEGDGFVALGAAHTGPESLADAATFDWPDTFNMNGVVYLRSEVSPAQIPDGLSKTYFAGEKFVLPDLFESGEGRGDDGPMFQGFDLDVLRWTWGNDTKCLPDSDRVGNQAATECFGSTHPGGFHMAMCDGSVSIVNLDIDRETHRRLGSRNDGEVVDTSAL